MSIVKAIARLRKGAKEGGLEGALASLGTELRSDTIPAPLRDAAARLATLIDPQPAAHERPVSLERALEAKAAHASSPHAGATSPSTSHAADAVCPVTGARADGTVGEAQRDHESAPFAPPAARPHDPTLELPSAPVPEDGDAFEPADIEGDGVKTVRARNKPRVRRSDSVRPPAGRVEARGSAREHGVEARGSAREQSSGPAKRESQRPEKGKEGLARERSVENTSGRSATRSAPKQPRGRAQANRKKT